MADGPGPVIEVRIKRGAGDSFLAEAELADGAFFGPEATTLDLASLRALSADPEAEGRALFAAVFRGTLQDAWAQAFGPVRGGRDDGTSRLLRVRLQFDPDASELHALRWERIQAPLDGTSLPISASMLTPFARLMPLSTPLPGAVGVRPVRMLVLLANPTGLPERLEAVPVEQEIRGLRDVLEPSLKAGRLAVTLAPGRTSLPMELADALRAAGFTIHTGPTRLEDIRKLVTGQHIVHFVGHGSFRTTAGGAGETALFLEDVSGAVDVVKEDRLRLAFAAIGDAPALVVLMACQSASTSGDEVHPLVGLAPQLVRMGVPAVVAMQDLLPMAATRILATEFYGALLTHGQVDLAMNAARAALSSTGTADWATPVLFTRLSGGRLLGGRAVADQLVPPHPPSRLERLREAVAKRPKLAGGAVVALLAVIAVAFLGLRMLPSETDKLLSLARQSGIPELSACRPWSRQQDATSNPSPYDYGAVAAIQCPMQNPFRQLALYRFSDAGKLGTWWGLKVYSTNKVAGNSGDCPNGFAGEGPVPGGRLACWVRSTTAYLRWSDVQSELYGLLDGKRPATVPPNQPPSSPGPGASPLPVVPFFPSPSPTPDPSLVRIYSWWQTHATQLR